MKVKFYSLLKQLTKNQNEELKKPFSVSNMRDVTKSRNGEPGTGNGERESGNECTAVIPIRIQNRLFNAT